MDNIELEYGNAQAADKAPHQYMMPDNDTYIEPHVGDNYQAEIPALETDAATDSVVLKNELEIRYQDLVILDDKTIAEDYDPMHDKLTTSFWSYAELQAFLISLYIFGKNLVKIRNFVESKKIGDILAYYYGKFYKSAAYSRWSKLRNARSKTCVIREHIVKGYAQQQLISRLLPTVSKEIQNILLEDTNNFNKGRISLDQYVSNLKAKVGINSLFDAIGIGEGKKNDLTGRIRDHDRMDQDPSFQLQVQIGKVLSSLSAEDIYKLLNSGSWRSKAKLNGLFSKVVWPRLVARGWQSVQPTAGSSYTVFLIPGVKKFSRKELSKGTDYYDSIADVLNVVESDPWLADLDENGSIGNTSTIMSKNLLHEVPICISEEITIVDITIVDISMFGIDGSSHIRKRISLPFNQFNETLITREEDSCSKQHNSNGCSSDAPFNHDSNGLKQYDLVRKHQLPLSDADTSPINYESKELQKDDLNAKSQPPLSDAAPLNSDCNGLEQDLVSKSQQPLSDADTDKKGLEQANLVDKLQPPLPDANAAPEPGYGSKGKCADSTEVNPSSAIEIAMQAGGKQEISGDYRRKGSRNRSLTMKALELQASGVMFKKRKRSDENEDCC